MQAERNRQASHLISKPVYQYNDKTIMSKEGTPGHFELRTVLQGHSKDVKHVIAAGQSSGALVTASKDNTVR